MTIKKIKLMNDVELLDYSMLLACNKCGEGEIDILSYLGAVLITLKSFHYEYDISYERLYKIYKDIVEKLYEVSRGGYFTIVGGKEYEN